MKRIGILLAAVAFAGIVSVSFAQGRGCGVGPSCGMGGMFGAIPNLTEQQIGEFQKFTDNCFKEMKPLQEKMQTLHAELNTMTSQQADEAKVNAKINEITALQASIMKKHIACKAEMEKILTPEQREYLKTHQGPNGHCGRHQMMEGAGPMGPGGCGMEGKHHKK
ncbi:MAG: Spy/CpxP family protein refolding chaperone [Chitinivibrionales bacterium]|nr:Spy/CpxP family protein refolding chaperone [Chitinivibrionales bacterium]